MTATKSHEVSEYYWLANLRVIYCDKADDLRPDRSASAKLYALVFLGGADKARAA